MASLKDVLSKGSERGNLWNSWICYAAVTALVVAVFAIAYTDWGTPTAKESANSEAAASKVNP